MLVTGPHAASAAVILGGVLGRSRILTPHAFFIALVTAGAVETIVCVKAIATDTVPPTINYQVPDPQCDLDYVPNTARYQKVNACLSNSFGLGGQNCCLVIKRMNE